MTETNLDTATILRRTFALLRANPLPAIVAIVLLTAISMAVTAAHPTSDMLLFWLRDLTGVVANFLLVTAVARSAGLMRDGGLALRLLHFLGLWIVTGTFTLIGLFLLVLPGIYLWSRWMIAVPLTVAEGRSIFGAIAESWRRTRSIVAPISAALVLSASGFIAATVIGFLMGQPRTPLTFPLACTTSALSYASTVLLWYLSTALYDLLRDKHEEYEQVFA